MVEKEEEEEEVDEGLLGEKRGIYHLRERG